MDLIFVDHGIFRFHWRSLYQISKGVYQIKSTLSMANINDKNNRGIKTIINLRKKEIAHLIILKKRFVKNSILH